MCVDDPVDLEMAISLYLIPKQKIQICQRDGNV